MKQSIRHSLTFVAAVASTCLIYELGVRKPNYVNTLVEVSDSLRTDRLKFISEIQDLNDYLKAHSNNFSSDSEKNEILAKIYSVEKDILVKARNIDDIKIVMDKILIYSPNLRKFPVLFPIRPGEARISSTFGRRVAPKKGASSNHKGIDYASPKGTPVYAPADGIVTVATKGVKGYGTMVKVKHSFGFETIYGHLSNFIVSPGDSVKIGKVIAYVGNTGVSTGPHLHYEILKNGVNLNPISFTVVMENKFAQK
ncbi:M23 family metallopeptidase [Sphingobacterium kyonggiense]